jgi:hypothetical protein
MDRLFRERGPEILRCIKICRAVYRGPIPYRDLLGFTNQRIIHGVIGKGFCRVLWNDDEFMVAFRGTREIVEDFLYVNLLVWMSRPSGKTFWSHFGFNRALASLNRRRGYDPGKPPPDPEGIKDIPAIEAILKLLNLYLGKRCLIITGHSLGGALATLAAVHISKHLELQGMKNRIEAVYTYGQPAVGGRSFYNTYGELHDRTFRFVHGADIVPFTPPFPPYRHVGDQYWLDDGGVHHGTSWRTRLFSNAIQCRLHLGVAHHLAARYQNAIEAIMAMP